MSTITVNHAPSEEKLKELGVRSWPIWTKETSKFPWTYDSDETCYVLQGDVTVVPDGGEPVHIKPGDLVHFPSGLSCTWEVNAPIRKHYRLG